MARYAGTNLYITFKGTAVSTDYRELSITREMGDVEVTAGSDAAATYVNTYKKGSFKMKLMDQTDGTALSSYKNMMVEGASGTLIWGEEGTATGKPKHTIVIKVDSLEPSLTFDGEATLDISGKFNAVGFVTDGVW